MVNSVFKLDKQNFRVKVGTFNKNNPSTIYLEGCTYILPGEETSIKNIDRFLSNSLIKSIKKSLKNNEIFDQTFISVVDCPTERIKPGKKTYMNIEFHLKQRGNYNFKELYAKSDNLVEEILNDFSNEVGSDGITFSKNK